MAGLFSRPKTPKPPLPPSPMAIPDIGEEAEDIARRKRPRGRRETFLTGALVPTAEETIPGLVKKKKKVFG